MFDLSIILPTRNRADHLLKALMGIERGTHCTYEVIVVDGASTDTTNDVLMLAGSIMGTRLRVIREGTQVGVGAACNKGVRLARGRNICILHDDSHPLDGGLNRAVLQLEERDDDASIIALFAHPDAQMNIAIDREINGRRYGLGHVCGTLIGEYPLAARRVFEAQPFDESLQTSAAIIDWSFAVWQAGAKIVPAIDAVLEEHFVDTGACPIDHAEFREVLSRWNLPAETTAFNASTPCTLRGRRRATRAA